ncbi:MAG: hypothetical protein AAF492_20360, partial [Verrucomicrobiota bacterium]
NPLNQLTNTEAGGPTRFQGHLNEPGEVRINGGPFKTTTDTNRFEQMVELPPGTTQSVSIIARDSAANTNTTT